MIGCEIHIKLYPIKHMTHPDREPVLLPYVGYEDAGILLGFHNPKVGGSIPPHPLPKSSINSIT
jgi:hypothetical protein